MKRKSAVALSLFLFCSIAGMARQNTTEMAFDLRSSGKIYVVVAVIAVVFAGIALYLFSLDKRLKKIERSK